MTKTVLLARPHPFIVSEMKPFLEDGGYVAAKLENMADLATQAKNSAGVVISLAISSAIGVSAFEVLSQLRKDAPRTPVLFAAMLDFDSSKSNLTRLAEQAGMQATILGVAAGNESASALGKPDTFFYISKDDLADPARRAIAKRMIQRHFR
ncbi:hypothetical protein [Herminiimonas fonticola]|uniref:Response regulatory domain-containing protein n=1 Tax=Herminiimonas fonticola TaxID=303380 RepID=A0A4R6G1T5_9BURK|nr:hypothetical protein [Herminiimonas fonticola]RBA23594.1 hypothetical protein Hfont_2405 [Herminiimonas fonticola]TDN87474.1 hypothetical protein EV677_2995 [Herminiimonas fonticola]